MCRINGMKLAQFRALGLMLVVLGSAAIICVLHLLSLGLMTSHKIGESCSIHR